MSLIVRFGFSVLNKIRKVQKDKVGLPKFPTALSHEHNDILATASYQEKKKDITPHQQYLIETHSMERPFNGNLWSEISPGFYHCLICNTRLFTFNHKYNSKTGFASFYKSVEGRVRIVQEKVNFQDEDETRIQFRTMSYSQNHKRCECAQCKTHLGAVFFDGPPPTFIRYSINSTLLKFYDMPDFQNPNIQRKIKRNQKIAKKVKFI